MVVGDTIPVTVNVVNVCQCLTHEFFVSKADFLRNRRGFGLLFESRSLPKDIYEARRRPQVALS